MLSRLAKDSTCQPSPNDRRTAQIEPETGKPFIMLDSKPPSLDPAGKDSSEFGQRIFCVKEKRQETAWIVAQDGVSCPTLKFWSEARVSKPGSGDISISH
jgi:hypothetical protein